MQVQFFRLPSTHSLMYTRNIYGLPPDLQLLYTPAVQPDDIYKQKYANVLYIAELSSTIQLPWKCEPI